MGGIALLVPNEEMLRQAHDVLQEMHEKLDFIKMIRTRDAVSEARQVIGAGAEVIIARGLQASIIKQYTNIPVVEIVLTEESVLEMLARAKRILRREDPVIAIVLFQNMSCGMAGLGERCGVQLREYCVQNPERLHSAAVQAIEERADLIIGGETVLRAADAAGVPSLFLVNAEDAMRNAIAEAKRLQAAFHDEKQTPETLAGRQAQEKRFPLHLPYQSRQMAACVHLAEQLSATLCPKLIIEPVGMLHNALAAAIHNHSEVSREKLLVYECVAGTDSWEALFGKQGLAGSGKGSIQINGIEHLDQRSQRRLLELMLFRQVIAVARTEALSGCLIPELYHCLRAFTIRIPSLAACPEDVPLLIDFYMQSICERLGRYHVLSKDALKWLCACRWQGNRTQLERFLERLLICAQHRSIGVAEVQELYEDLYGVEEAQVFGRQNVLAEMNAAWSAHTASGFGASALEAGALSSGASSADGARQTENGQSALVKAEEARIVEALCAHMGNRTKAAEALGISKATLWRKMKRYGLLETESY